MVLAVFSVGFFCAGWYAHQPVTTGVEDSPDFSSRSPFMALTYDLCPPNVSVPDQYACIYNLAQDTLNEANMLAQKLPQTLPIEPAQEAKEAYFNSVCDLDMALLEGGTGATSEREACRYYYALKYLDTLKSLENISRTQSDS